MTTVAPPAAPPAAYHATTARALSAILAPLARELHTMAGDVETEDDRAVLAVVDGYAAQLGTARDALLDVVDAAAAYLARHGRAPSTAVPAAPTRRDALTLPPLLQTVPGRSRPYRLWTVDTLPLPRAVPLLIGHDVATVTHTGWTFSTSTDDATGRTTLHSHRGGTGGAPLVAHDLDGTTFPTLEAARVGGWLGGLIALMAYEDTAARYGLPVAPTLP